MLCNAAYMPATHLNALNTSGFAWVPCPPPDLHPPILRLNIMSLGISTCTRDSTHIFHLRCADIRHVAFASTIQVQTAYIASTLPNLHDLKRWVTGADINFSSPTRIQQAAIPVLLQGRDALVNAPTGSGKTLAYLAPIIHDLQASAIKSWYLSNPCRQPSARSLRQLGAPPDVGNKSLGTRNSHSSTHQC